MAQTFHQERTKGYECTSYVYVTVISKCAGTVVLKTAILLLASSPGSPPPLCYTCDYLHNMRNVCLNVGEGEPGQLQSLADTDDAFGVARAIHVHVVNTERIISVRT